MREREILQHVSGGLSNAEIADVLVVSENTVKTHIKNILAWISQIDPSGDWRSCDYYEYSDY